MDILNEVMEDLLIEQEDRILEPIGKNSFAYIALRAKKVIDSGTGVVSNANKN